ncbi:transcriptional regulator, AbrB family [Anaerobranca californiensis DSM 14826]|jgi:AbrB family transcriptional regulator (stage V sporulation protein T)|uniref:Transcriptional regulator, AbrB family n=1 Tax=Anaerobranca californiensis DSM 14826 TaxID=1120989 RepID=A0A1M6PIJ5_9FIRM|nr:transcriptional regulator, AbrB family [Anaerobranca californiensis DSM 14826]
MVKATGIVRRIDDLGRVVIPKEIRRTLKIREGDPLEIFVDRDGEVILKKYSPIGELGDFAKEYAESLYDSLGHICAISDRDNIIAVSGGSKKEYLNKPIGPAIERAMEERRTIKGDQDKDLTILADEENKYTAKVIAPIIANGDPIGAVIVCSKEPGISFSEVEQKMAEAAASFLAKQMSQ